MRRSTPMARFAIAWLLAGIVATLISIISLSALSALYGHPVLMPLNATTHGLYGPAAATAVVDWSHTALGTAIHVLSCFFWAAVAVVIFRLVRGADMARVGIARVWIAGLGTALLAAVVDYGLMPAPLSPGWDLALPPLGVIGGFVALGIGLSLGLGWALAINRRALGVA